MPSNIKHDYIIAYDIADEKRLRKVAKLLESETMRIQYSVFFIQAHKTHIEQLQQKLQAIINQAKDDLRIYQIDIENSFHLQAGLDLKSPLIIS